MISHIKSEPFFEETSDFRPATPLPDKIHRISMKDYLEESKRNPNSEVSKDLKMKKVLLGVMERRPEIWRNTRNQECWKQWNEVGVEVFERSGVVVGAPVLRRMFGGAKVAMKSRLRAYFERQKAENKVPRPGRALADWDLYPHFRWYIEHLAEENPRFWKLVETDPDSDDCFFEGYVNRDLGDNMSGTAEEEPEEDLFEEIVVEEDQEVVEAVAEEPGTSENPFPPGPWDQLRTNRDLSTAELLSIIRESTIALFHRHPNHARQIQHTLMAVFMKIREKTSVEDSQTIFDELIREEEIRERLRNGF